MRSLESTFAPEVLGDMFCYVQLSLELSARAKGDLLRREMGFPRCARSGIARPASRANVAGIAHRPCRKAGSLAADRPKPARSVGAAATGRKPARVTRVWRTDSPKYI